LTTCSVSRLVFVLRHWCAFLCSSTRRGRQEDDDLLEDGEHRSGHGEPGGKRKKKEKKEKKEKEQVTDGTDNPDPEIAEANRLRAALGLKPLRP